MRAACSCWCAWAACRCLGDRARFGAPLVVESGRARPAAEWLNLLETVLAATQDELALESMQRDPALFEDLIVGRAGVGGVYDVWRRLKSWVRGEAFRPEHMRPEDAEMRVS